MVEDPNVEIITFDITINQSKNDCEAHFYQCKDGYPKFLSTHVVSKLNENRVYDFYTCYIYVYVYECAWCGAPGGNFYTHSIPFGH